MKRATAATLGKETVDICNVGFYLSPKGKRVEIGREVEAAKEASRYFPASSFPLPAPDSQTRFAATQCITVDQLTLQAAATARQSHPDAHIGVLNFASAKNPGGGFLKGSQAQEESIARSSALYPCLLQHDPFYRANKRDQMCIYTNGVIFSKAVPVFRKDSGQLLEEPYLVSFLTCPAPNAGVALPRLLESPSQKKKTIFGALETRIRCILEVALSQGCTVLILGAFGCGVFANSVSDVIAIFHSLLVGPEAPFCGLFEITYFAVPSVFDKGLTNRRFSVAFPLK